MPRVPIGPGRPRGFDLDAAIEAGVAMFRAKGFRRVILCIKNAKANTMQGRFGFRFAGTAASYPVLSFVDVLRGQVPVAGQGSPAAGPRVALGRAVWLGALGVSCMAVVQAMMFSFLERIGMDRGFGLQAVNAVLVALGLVNLLPAGLAALLQRRWPAERVVLCGPLAQAVLVLVITQSQQFAPYAAAASVFAAVMIFTHTFAFGLLARLDPSGRALAATPAMMMAGAALGPVLGGTLVKWLGYPAVGAVACAAAALSVFSFSRLPRSLPLTHPAPEGAGLHSPKLETL